MSLHRYDAKRDRNEPAIVSALEALGCVVWRVSGKGLPDLIVLRAGKKWLADVKGPKETETDAQWIRWEEAATKARCAVFILRTPEDAAAMLNNALQPWEPSLRGPSTVKGKLKPASNSSRKGDAAKAPKWPKTRNGHPGYNPPRSTPVGRRCSKGCGNHGWDTTNERTWRCSDCGMPPDPQPVDAAKEAEATFAPADLDTRECGCIGRKHRLSCLSQIVD